jgi:hypothetical protein
MSAHEQSTERVFLCYAHADKARVRKLYTRLREDGFAPWLDEEDLLAGQHWQVEIPHAVRSSRWVVVCLSERSTGESGYVREELQLALDAAAKQPKGAIFVIPVRLEDCQVPGRLAHLHRIDLHSSDGYSRLKRALLESATHPVAKDAQSRVRARVGAALTWLGEHVAEAVVAALVPAALTAALVLLTNDPSSPPDPSPPPPASTITTSTTESAPPPRPPPPDRRGLGPRRLQAEKSLQAFASARMGSGVCEANKSTPLPKHARGQQICRKRGYVVVYTRLAGPNATSSFLTNRFKRTEQRANAGGCPSADLGTWSDHNDVTQGRWAFRQSGRHAVVLWSYKASNVAARLTSRTRSAANICRFWSDVAS